MHFHKLVAHIQLPDSFSEVLKLLNSELVTQYFSGKTPIGPFCRCLQQKARKSWGTVTVVSMALQLFLFFFYARKDRPGLPSSVQNLTHCSHSHWHLSNHWIKRQLAPTTRLLQRNAQRAIYLLDLLSIPSVWTCQLQLDSESTSDYTTCRE